MMGFEFATYCNNYLHQQGLATRSISKIDSNPAKSKHLETATTKLFDQEIDFCNLRTEVYTEDSRIPTAVTFGTPTEDAYRRDITINSLFYNINTNTVEDFTNQGLPDLSKGLIRTPLAPYETFRDDPLRVLRCIRFGSRFGFEMVSELSEAAKDRTIKDALVNKISRERIGTEIDKMLSGPSPLLSLQLIHQYGLYATVFEAPEIVSQPPEDAWQAVRAVGVVQWLLQEGATSPLRQITSKDERRTIYLAASLLPYLSVMSELKKRPIYAVQLVLRDSLKLNNHDINTISTLFRGIPTFQQAVQRLDEQHSLSRSELGMLIRDIGSLWQTCLKMALVHDLLSLQPSITWDRPEKLDTLLGPAEEVVRRYHQLLDHAIKYSIQDAHIWKPMIDGKKITQLLDLKPGPVVQQLLRVMMIWQLEHPEGTVDDCATMMKQYWVQNSARHQS
ncbi:hypothetical protein BCR42DRAFT_459357 [Absidia repens]|uniref:tRNA nucleotidyltransferase n=1 Tax=Absidia repens TaxID=90262 RepID=A0A1X2ISJ3_9FUNG|nr:hypothetical protein BCR42DRAFT_459357 [Absidia repens]